MRGIVTAVVVLALASAACEPTPPPPPSLDCTSTGTATHRDLRYAESPGVAPALQSLDVYLPVRPDGCGPTPIVAYVHGGGFRNGSKSNKVTDKINLFNGEGWAFASIEYRLVGNPGAGPTHGVYPAQQQDIASALDYLVDNAGQYGLDGQKIMLLGHSAGAFLVALESTDQQFVNAEGVELNQILCTAPLDTETFDVRNQIDGGGSQALIYRTVFGDEPVVWTQASPIHNVEAGKAIPDFLLFTQGGARRLAGNQAFKAALNAAGIGAEVVRADPLTHEEVNEAVGKPGDTVVTPPLMTFFRACVTELP